MVFKMWNRTPDAELHGAERAHHYKPIISVKNKVQSHVLRLNLIFDFTIYLKATLSPQIANLHYIKRH